MTFTNIPKLFETTGLTCASMVADRGYQKEVLVMLANLHDKPRTVQKGAFLCRMEIEPLNRVTGISQVCGLSELGLTKSENV